MGMSTMIEEYLEKDTFIVGSFGGDTPDPPKEDDDTLSSRQTLRALMVISEGEIESVDDIYLDRTNVNNYKKITSEHRTGLPSQAYIKGFSKVETPHPSSSSVELTYNTPVTKTVSSVNTDAVRITLQFAALLQVDDKGNTKGYTATHRFQRKLSSSGTWETVKNSTKTGKSSSAYAYDVRIDRPTGSEGLLWDFRVIRTTFDDTSKQKSKAAWTNTIEIQDKKELTYPNCALIGITARNAIRLGGSFPTIMARAKGIKVKVPSNISYDYLNKTYTGVAWDGSFDPVYRWTSNPAWLLYGILTNTRYGKGIPEGDINKFSFFELAKYCDEKVNIEDSLGNVIGTECRYEIHNQFTQREVSRGFLEYFLSICNANFSEDSFGNLTVIFDAPQDATRVENNSTVIDGIFEYSSSDIEERYTRVNVTYNNASDFGNTDTVTWPDESPTSMETSYVNKYGDQVTDIPLVGCMSKGQAIRKAKWLFYTSCVDPNIISFKKFINGIGYKIGEVIEVIDDANQQVEQQGIVVSYESLGPTSLALYLDRRAFTSGTNKIGYVTSIGYKVFTFVSLADDPNSSTYSKCIINTTGYTQSDLYPITNSPFVLQGAIKPTTWKVSSISYDSESKVSTIIATQYDINKFSYVDSGVYVKPPEFVDIKNLQVPAVTGLSVTERYYKDEVEAYSSLYVSWDWSDSSATVPYNPTYTVFYRNDNNDYIKVEGIPTKFFELPNALPGVYEFIVYANNLFALKSDPTSTVFNYKTGSIGSSTLLPPINLRIEGTSDTVFEGKDAVIVWDYNTGNNTVSDRLLDYVVEIWDKLGVTKKNTYFVSPETIYNNETIVESGRFVYTFDRNDADFGIATREFIVKVYSRDLQGKLSTAITDSFSNPAPAAVSGDVILGMDAAYINIDKPLDKDIVGFVAHMSTTNGFTPGPSTLVYLGASPNIIIKINPNVTYYFRLAAYDIFSIENLNYSSQYSGIGLGLGVITWSFSGIVFKANDPEVNKVSWTAGTAISDYGDSFAISAGNATWTSGILYLYYKKGETTIQSTTVLGVAIQSGTRILATYQGGTNLIVGGGDAFVSGDKILAGTVGAEQLIADSAVITATAQIANAIITNAMIKDYIQSTDYVPGTSGWRIHKTDGAEFTGDVIIGNTLRVSSIVSGDISKITSGLVTSSIAVNQATETEVGSLTVTRNLANPIGSSVLVRMSVDMECATVTERVRFKILNSSGTVIGDSYLYNRGGADIDCRYFHGTRNFIINIPSDGTYTAKVYVYHNTTPAKYYNDVHLEVIESRT
jgi:predicted phage tail protein